LIAWHPFDVAQFSTPRPVQHELMMFFQEVFEHALDALIVVDPACKIRYANAMSESLFGHRRDELIGREIEMLIPARFDARHLAHRTEFATQPRGRSMGNTHMELYGLRKHDGEFPVDVMLRTLAHANDILTLCAVRDATERKSAIDRL
jgi:PAS domain S-box-containing protein